MNGSNFMQGWVALTGSIAIIALILTALGLMLGIVKTADALKNTVAILGIVIVLMFVPGVLLSAWSGMSIWQQIGLVAIGIGIWKCLRPRPKARKSKGE